MKAVVTGGCSGLGKCFTEYLLSLNYEVYAFYNTSKDNATELSKKYSNLHCIKCDINNENEIIDALYDIEDIDILINNAAYQCDNYYLDKTKKEFMHVLETNVVGTFLVTKYAFNKINNGIVINMSSNNALENYNPISMDYDASKAAINMLTKDFSLIKSNVKVISICPGWINTESVMEASPEYINEEMKKVNQSKLIDKNALVKYIIDNKDKFENGSINEIKEL